ANSLQGVVTQALLPTVDGGGRVAALEILLPDDAVRNLVRQEGRAAVHRHADELVARHADDGAGARRSRPPPRRLARRGARADVAVRAAARDPRARRHARPGRGQGQRPQGGGLVRDDSIWKKEISFRRKPKPPQAEKVEQPKPAEAPRRARLGRRQPEPLPPLPRPKADPVPVARVEPEPQSGVESPPVLEPERVAEPQPEPVTEV